MQGQGSSYDGLRHRLTLEGPLPGTPQVLRRVNQIQVFSSVRRLGPVARPVLAEDTGLSKVTVDSVVKDLLDAGLVVEDIASPELARMRPGPRPRLISFKGDRKYVLGVDIGGTKSLILVADLTGHVVAQKRVITQGAATRESLLETLRWGIAAALESAGVDVQNLVGMVIGTPGIIDPDSQHVVLAPQLPDWHGFSPSEALRPRRDIPVTVANEVHLALLGEEWKGAGRGREMAAYLHIGAGVGLGLVVDGNPLRGAHGAAGEVGYLPIGPDDPERPEGTGRFEWAVGGPAYVRRAEALIRTGGGRGIQAIAGDRPLDAQVVFQAAADGDPEAQRIVDDITQLTAEGVSAIAAVIDPKTVIIGGGVSRAGEQLLGPIRRHVDTLLPHKTELIASELADEAVAIGAVRVAIDQWEASLFSLDH